MEKMGLNQIREKYLKFFESKEHLVLPSFSLIPRNDKSLLLISAGMAPLKPYFTGQEIPPSKRVTTCQKCIRTGDIERVGKTARHATFFEMLGNFSFGDYFKESAIPWSWEFVTEVLKLPKDKLWITIYLDDDEAFEIWNKKVGIPPERVVRMGKEDNFWEIGVGPCGPCSEIYFDRGESKGCGKPDCAIGCDCDRFVEFWNLVFTQFDRDEEGNYNRLAKPNIDTGMGLERIATIMQGVDTIFEVDTMKNILDEVSKVAEVKYGEDSKRDSSLRLITDHIRSVTFMVSDGIIPSNEGRGYVLRRLLRRAARHGKLLGVEKSFLWDLCDVVIENSSKAYPELEEKKEYIKKVIKLEEERFAETIDQGINILSDYVKELKSQDKTVLSGDKVFKLYDTYGFPVELTLEILEETSMAVDLDGFNREMNAQRERARSAREETNFMGSDVDIYSTLPADMLTRFSGYNNTISSGKVLAVIRNNQIIEQASEGEDVTVVLDNTSFYPEMGGQIGDKGYIEGANSRVEVLNCRKTTNGKILHFGKILNGTVSVKDNVTTIVDIERRTDIERNHTATHLLHTALRHVLGNHVEQSGSLVTEDRLRFDFTHFEALSPESLKKVEKLVNDKIMESLSLNAIETSIDEARRMGAMALFGEKYGALVRVVKAGDFSMELCGGTHVANTSVIGLFKVISEGGIAAGVRRIEAITGKGVLQYIESQDNTLKEIASVLKTTPRDIAKRAEAVMLELKEKDKEIDNLRLKMTADTAGSLIESAREIKGVKVITASVALDVDGLRNLGDKLKDKLGKSIVVLASNKDNKITFISMSSKDAISAGAHSGNIIKEVAKIAGGGGGGKPEMAQAGGKDPNKINEALDAVYNIVENMIK